MYFPPMRREVKETFLRLRKSVRWKLLLAFGLFGVACWATLMSPPSSTWGATWDAFFFVVTLVFLGDITRRYRQVCLVLNGRATVLPSGQFGFVCVISPRKKNAPWKVSQLEPFQFWNLAAMVVPPVGRGPSFSHAFFSLLASRFPNLQKMSKEEIDTMRTKLEEAFKAHVETSIQNIRLEDLQD